MNYEDPPISDQAYPANMDLNPSATGGIASQPTIIDKLKPHQIYLLTQLGLNSKSMAQAADYLPMISQGKTPFDIYNQEKDQQRQEQVAATVQGFHDDAQTFVDQTKDMKDPEYETAKQKFMDSQTQLTAEMGSTPKREKVKTKMPDALSLGFALFGAAMNPRYASNILAAPFHASLDVRGMKQNEADQKYDDELNKHRERLQILGTVAQQAYRDMEVLRQQSSENAKRVAGAIGRILTSDKHGEPTIALQEAIDAGLPQDRIKAYAAIVSEREKILKTEEEKKGLKADLDLENAKATLANNQNAPAEKEKARIEKEKDNFRQWVSTQFPADRALGPDEVKRIEDERKRRADALKISIDQFDKYGERKISESQRIQQDKYNADQSGTSIEGQIKRETLKGLIARNEKALQAPASKDNAVKQKELSKLTDKVEDARQKLDALKSMDVPGIDTYADGSPNTTRRDKFYDDIRQAFAEEYAAVKRKRQLVGGKVPTPDEYLKERYPDLYAAKKAGKAMIEKLGDLFGAVKEASGKMTPPKGGLSPALPAGVPGGPIPVPGGKRIE